MVLLIATLLVKAGLSMTVLFIAMLIFDVLAFHRMKTPEAFNVVGGAVVVLGLITYTLSAIFFIFS